MDCDTDIFALMMGLAEGGQTYDREMKALEKQVAEVGREEDIKPKIPYVMPVARVPEFDERFDLSDMNNREEFTNEVIFGPELTLFSGLTPTTITVNGNFTNVAFNEEELINRLTTDEEILACKSNFGKMFYTEYEPPTKSKKTNRGRKKKEKKVKIRKSQGTGDEMNSQVTFIIKSTTVNTENGKVPSNAKVYKFKVFRTGKLQLPGVRPADINDVLDCAKILANELDLILHVNDASRTMLANLNPVMKNYKFEVRLPPGHVFILPELKKIMQRMEIDYRRDIASPQPPHPTFTFGKVLYGYMAILFDTPIPTRSDKKVRVKLFMGGKVNILGGLHPDVSRRICEYLHYVIENNLEQISGEAGD
jgi:hypothetical protein